MIQNIKPDRPKIKIPLTGIDWIAEVTALSFLILLIALPIYFYNQLPDIIPVHFNASGEPDGYGGNNR